MGTSHLVFTSDVAGLVISFCGLFDDSGLALHLTRAKDRLACGIQAGTMARTGLFHHEVAKRPADHVATGVEKTAKL